MASFKNVRIFDKNLPVFPSNIPLNPKDIIIKLLDSPKINLTHNPIIDEKIKQMGLFTPFWENPYSRTKSYVVSNQKILVVDEKNISTFRSHYINQKPLTIQIDNTNINVMVVRISEYPNSFEEYETISYLVLVEWGERYTALFGSLLKFGGLLDQASNSVLSPDPDSKPGDPIKASSKVTHTYPSFFQPVNTALVDYYKTPSADSCIVAVMDTGVKYTFDSSPVGCGQLEYKDKNGNCQPFHLAKVTKNGLPSLGYCSITDYLRAASDSYDYKKSYFQGITELGTVKNATRDQILNSPYDDNKVNILDEYDEPKTEVGWHGSTITAIINQKAKVPVLPIKVFNNGGQGFLFDILCGFNYILAQKRAGLPIKVVNASFVSAFHHISEQAGIEMLRKKIDALSKEGIWIVTAAGNEDEDLDVSPKFPACFSKDCKNVITVGSSRNIQRARLAPRETIDFKKNAFTAKESRDILQKLKIDSNKWVMVLDGIERIVFQNFSNQAVNLAVQTHFDSKYLSPFLNGESISGTSFAAAYVSAKIAKLLSEGRVFNTKEELLSALNPVYDPSIADKIENGRVIDPTL